MLLLFKKTAAAKVFSIFVMLLYTVIATRILGTEAFGGLTYWISIIIISGVIFSAGIQRVALVLSEITMEEGTNKHFYGITLKMFAIVASWSLCIFLIIQLSSIYFSQVTTFLDIGVVAFCLLAFLRATILVQTEVLKGLHHGAASVLVQEGLLYLFLILLLLLFFYIDININPIFIYGGALACCSCLALFIIFCANKPYKGTLVATPVLSINQTYQFLIVDMFLILQLQGHFVILGYYGGLELVAFMALGLRWGQFGGFTQEIMNSSYSGVFSKLLRENKKEELSILMSQCATLSFIQSIIYFVVIFLVGSWGLELIYGVDYVSTFIPLLIVSFGFIINTACGLAGRVLILSGLSKALFKSVVCSVILGCAISYSTVDSFGVLGVTIGLCVTMIVHNIAMAYMCKKYLGISTWISIRGFSHLLNNLQYKLESKRQENKIFEWLEEILRKFESKLWRMQGCEIIECFGDSHARVFRKLNGSTRTGRLKYRTTFVRGASARSLTNYNSQTNARKIFQKRLTSINKKSKIIFLAGEVDCGATFWLQQKKNKNLDEITFINESIKRYSTFLNEMSNMGFEVYVLSAPLPILTDDEAVNNSIGLRQTLDCLQSDVERLTQLFNCNLQKSLEKTNIHYINITKYILGADNATVDTELKSQKIGDHHYDREQYAKRILNAMKMECGF
jgi:O-antigen/teichoic acid export membrane protein